MSRSIKWLVIFGSFLVAVFLASFIFPLSLVETSNLGYLLIISLILMPALVIKSWHRIIFIAAFFFSLGLAFYYFQLPIVDENHLISYQNKEAKVLAWVCDEPVYEIKYTQYQLCILDLRVGNRVYGKVQGKILLTQPAIPSGFNYADKLSFKTKLAAPKNLGDFDFQTYLAGKNIYALAYPQKISKTTGITKNDLGWQYYFTKLKQSLFKLKNFFISASKKVIKEPFNALLAGLLFGTKAGLPKNLEEAFIRTGLVHIIVVSGYNISILIKVFVTGSKNWLPKFSFWLGTLAIIFFVLMVGSSAPAIRAGLMAWILLIGSQKGRQANQLLLLFTVALIMTLFNSKVIRYDMGFQLSFLALIGLIYFSPIVQVWLKKLNIKFWLPKQLRPFLQETLAAQILTFPLILYSFGRISLIAPLANILVLPLIPWAMLLGFISSLLAAVIPFLGQLVGWLEWLILKYIVYITETFSSINWASIDLRWFNIYLMIFCYILIAYIIYRYAKAQKKSS